MCGDEQCLNHACSYVRVWPSIYAAPVPVAHYEAFVFVRARRQTQGQIHPGETRSGVFLNLVFCEREASLTAEEGELKHAGALKHEPGKVGGIQRR